MHVDIEGEVVDEVEFTTQILIKDALAGDSESESALIARYQSRLMMLAAKCLPTDTRRRVEPDDVVQSACRIFIDRLRSGQVAIAAQGDLWQILMRITLNKIRSLARKHRSARRSLKSEMPSELAVDIKDLLSREPTPEAALLLAETIDELLAKLPKEKQRQVVLMRLQGHKTSEIAHTSGLSVERVRQIVRWAHVTLAAHSTNHDFSV